MSLKTSVLNTVFEKLIPYKTMVDESISASIEKFGKKNGLRDACEYALVGGGKRLRPIIVHLVSEGLEGKINVSDVACATEFFHVASLVADDLPSMDNDDFRRGRPTVHKVYGEATAILTSFSLIASGFEAIAENSKLLSDNSAKNEILRLSILSASRLNGINGLVGGQFIDLNPPDLDKQVMNEIIEKKTVSLFELSFVLGYLFGGGSVDNVQKVCKTALHFGAAFQILDDVDDMGQDALIGKKVNYANLFGIDEAKKAIFNHVSEFQKSLYELNIRSSLLEEMGSCLLVQLEHMDQK